MQVLIAISGFCGFCSRIGNAPCTTPFDFLFVISIHVLAWGTTTNEAARLSVVHISIHVPAWGTTALVYSEKEDVCDFNPRSREGNDSKFSQIFFAFLCNKYNFSTFYYPFSLFFGVIHFTFLIFVVRILPVFYVYF